MVIYLHLPRTVTARRCFRHGVITCTACGRRRCCHSCARGGGRSFYVSSRGITCLLLRLHHMRDLRRRSRPFRVMNGHKYTLVTTCGHEELRTCCCCNTRADWSVSQPLLALRLSELQDDLTLRNKEFSFENLRKKGLPERPWNRLEMHCLEVEPLVRRHWSVTLCYREIFGSFSSVLHFQSRCLPVGKALD